MIARTLAARRGAGLAWPPDVIGMGALVALVHALQRLIYPFAAVLASRTQAEAALGVLGATLAVSALRALVADAAARRARRHLYAALARAIADFPAVAAPATPPLEQLESAIARGVPWVEAYVVQTLPTLVGCALALPVFLWLGMRTAGALPTLLAVGALLLAAGIAAAIARLATAASEGAWGEYQAIASLIGRGLRARLELRAHGLAAAHQLKLQARVREWSASDRRARLLRACTGLSVPVSVAALALLIAHAFQQDAVSWLIALIAAPQRDTVSAGLLAAASLPLLFHSSQGLSDLALERPHLAALTDFIVLHARVRAPLAASGASGQPGAPDPARPVTVGALHVQGAEFPYPSQGGGARSAVFADFIWGAGESVALLGPNGAGKTTVALGVLGLLQPARGRCRVMLNGAWSDAGALLGHAAYLPQQSYFDEAELVRDAVRFLAPGVEDRAIAALLGRLWSATDGQREGALERRTATLSTGERRLVALARVLLHPAPLIVLDEPEANLDSAARARVAAVLREIKAEKRMLILTHDLQLAAVADRSLTFDGHRLGSPPAAP